MNNQNFWEDFLKKENQQLTNFLAEIQHDPQNDNTDASRSQGTESNQLKQKLQSRRMERASLELLYGELNKMENELQQLGNQYVKEKQEKDKWKERASVLKDVNGNSMTPEKLEELMLKREEVINSLRRQQGYSENFEGHSKNDINYKYEDRSNLFKKGSKVARARETSRGKKLEMLDDSISDYKQQQQRKQNSMWNSNYKSSEWKVSSNPRQRPALSSDEQRQYMENRISVLSRPKRPINKQSILRKQHRKDRINNASFMSSPKVTMKPLHRTQGSGRFLLP
eukprot:gb/GECH01006699.1/.p1 GENE.gb/GECH01006699.1/~~gb/GECH01006699.1/.p1  ORF type:complete len:283 (+),score=66.62 gb/GECH01006699.1/:1-849(+)